MRLNRLGNIAKYGLKDTFHLVDKLDGLNACTNHMMSLNVVSLFTNILLEDTIDIVCNYASLTNLPRKKLRELLLYMYKECTISIQYDHI